jgi:hypothetical protein
LKLSKKEVLVVSGIDKLAKTNDARDFLKKVSKLESIKSKKFTFVLSEKNVSTKRYLKNLEGIKINIYRDLNVFSVLFGGTLIFDNDIFAKKVAKK